MEIFFVIAGDYVQYCNWVKRNKLNPNQYRYLHDEFPIIGTKSPTVYLVDGYEDSPMFYSKRLRTVDANFITVV